MEFTSFFPFFFKCNKDLFVVHASCPLWVDWRLAHAWSSLWKEVPGAGTLWNTDLCEFCSFLVVRDSCLLSAGAL